MAVTEVSPKGLLHFQLKNKQLSINHSPDHFVLYENKDFMIQAKPLNHGSIYSIAYSYKEKDKIQIDKAALKQLSLPPGPWLTELKNDRSLKPNW